MSPKTPTALIAEDEPLLALALQAELAQVWPALQIAATVGDGLSAVAQALALRPDVLFFDIRMPGQNGLEAAAALADAWPLDVPFPALVFVTAYDQHALEAFEAQAVDYLLKPVQTTRLARTVEKIQRSLPGSAAAPGMEHTLDQLRQLLAPAPAPASPACATSRPAWAARSTWCRCKTCCISRPPTNTCACLPLDASF